MCRAEEALQVFNSEPRDMNPSLLAFYASNALFRLGRNEEASVMNQAMKWLQVTADEASLATAFRGVR
jgi:hypothetical protein